MREPFSITSRTPSAYYDPDESCLKTSQLSLLSEAPALLERLPDWGTTVGGDLFALPTPEQLTAVRDGSASLPTPVVNDMGAGKTVEWWDEWAPRQKSSEGKKAVHGKSLSIETRRLLPTPMSRDHKDTGENTAYAEHAETQPTLPRIMMILREENEEEE